MSRRIGAWLATSLGLALLASCASRPDPQTFVLLIESSPSSLDPRVGTDAQSERIGKLIYDPLLRRDEHFQVRPWLAERWTIPDPLTYVFHLRQGVRFHDGRALTARDVKYTFDSVLDGSVLTAKASAYRFVERVEAPDEQTVVFRLKEPYAGLLWNLSDGAIGIVPEGSGSTLGQAPMGSGPFRFLRATQDSEVVLARNEAYWNGVPNIARVRFAVVPDATTRALELRKGSADAAINALSADMVVALAREPGLRVISAPGTIYAYLAFNLRDPILKDPRVRQAIAYAIDRETLIRHLWRDYARPAAGLLPESHWAFASETRRYEHDPAKARQILDEAGYLEKNGIRFTLTMKTSTEETTRLLAAVLQQQLRQAGIALEIRSFEFGTFYSDIVKGAFQLYSLRWIGGNEDPDIFEHVFHSASFPPRRANRGFYVNPRVDELLDRARRESDPEIRRPLYAEVQTTIAEELPYVSLWYMDNVAVHSRRVHGMRLSPSGDYDFLRTVTLQP